MGFLEKHKIVRRLTLVWACWLITVVTLRFTDPEAITKIPDPMSKYGIAIVGILTVVIGFYQHHRSKEENDKPDLH